MNKLTGAIVIATMVLSLCIVNFQPALADGQEYDPIIPGLASLVIPGAGQVLNDQPDKALTHFLVGLGIQISLYSLPYYGVPVPPFAGVAYLGWCGYSAYDAYTVAEQDTKAAMRSEPNQTSSNYNYLALNPVSRERFSLNKTAG